MDYTARSQRPQRTEPMIACVCLCDLRDLVVQFHRFVAFVIFCKKSFLSFVSSLCSGLPSALEDLEV